jgi:DNA-binding PadR family transcriptional regulator
MAKGHYPAEFELYVLAALVHLGDDAYGMTVRQTIEARSGRAVSIGAVYTTLERLQDKGYVTFRVSDPRPVPGGRARKYIRLTPRGRRVFDDATAMLLRMLPSPAMAGPRR